MTRINLLKPKHLLDQHLLAEHRELPRVLPLAAAAYTAGRKVQIPPKYTLGKGHVTFFYDKLPFLVVRHYALTQECISRGFKVQPEPLTLLALPNGPMTVWEPDADDVEVNLARLREKVRSPPRPNFYRHRGVVVPVTWYDDLADLDRGT